MVVKDEADVVGFVTHAGTVFLDDRVATVDAHVVQRLLAQGCIVIGKSNMHEMALGTTGFNRHFGTPRNPYHPDHHTGGSSSGTAAAIASGLVPLGTGSDAGGSIRIPAGFCGVFGLKATFGRVSHHGCAPLCWSVNHVGPLAATAADLILGCAGSQASVCVHVCVCVRVCVSVCVSVCVCIACVCDALTHLLTGT